MCHHDNININNYNSFNNHIPIKRNDITYYQLKSSGLQQKMITCADEIESTFSDWS